MPTARTHGRLLQVLPVYVFDPRFFAASAWGSPKTGPFRAKFVLQSVLDLKRRLRGVGSDLLVAVGQPEHILPRLLAQAAAPQQQGPLVLTMEETTSEELRVDRKVRPTLWASGTPRELQQAAPSQHVWRLLPARAAGRWGAVVMRRWSLVGRSVSAVSPPVRVACVRRWQRRCGHSTGGSSACGATRSTTWTTCR